ASMVLTGVCEHAAAAAAMGLLAQGRDQWRVVGWHRLRALWPFADPEADAFLLARLKEPNRPSAPPPAPFLTTDRSGFVLVCGRSTVELARNAGMTWDRERGL